MAHTASCPRDQVMTPTSPNLTPPCHLLSGNQIMTPIASTLTPPRHLLLRTIAAPPTAEHISSFLLHIRQRATDAAGDPALSAATPADTADDTSRGHTNDPDDDTPAINVDIASTVDITADIDDATMTVDHGADAQPNGDASVVPVGQQRQRKRRCSPAKIERQQRRRWYDGQDLGDTARTPDSGGAQTGGDGGAEREWSLLCTAAPPPPPFTVCAHSRFEVFRRGEGGGGGGGLTAVTHRRAE